MEINNVKKVGIAYLFLIIEFKSLIYSEISSEYSISKLTISDWLEKSKPINIDNKVTTQAILKKMARLEE